MWTIWNAPSDRDYYEQANPCFLDEDDDRCLECGAGFGQACEEDCPTNRSAHEDELDDGNFDPETPETPVEQTEGDRRSGS